LHSSPDVRSRVGNSTWHAQYLVINTQRFAFLVIRGGHAQLFFESATAIPQLERSTSAIAIPQLFKKCCSATATPQFRKRNFFRSPQLQVRNLKALLLQFSAYFWPWSSLKVDIFLPPGVFCYGEDFKGTVARDFRPATVTLTQVFGFH
jgi:hypothetical protein